MKVKGNRFKKGQDYCEAFERDMKLKCDYLSGCDKRTGFNA